MKKGLVIAGLLTVFILSLLYTCHIQATTGMGDMRSRVIGTRLVKEGRLPYFYHWYPGDPMRYFSGAVFDDTPGPVCVSLPTLRCRFFSCVVWRLLRMPKSTKWIGEHNMFFSQLSPRFLITCLNGMRQLWYTPSLYRAYQGGPGAVPGRNNIACFLVIGDPAAAAARQDDRAGSANMLIKGSFP